MSWIFHNNDISCAVLLFVDVIGRINEGATDSYGEWTIAKKGYRYKIGRILKFRKNKWTKKEMKRRQKKKRLVNPMCTQFQFETFYSKCFSSREYYSIFVVIIYTFSHFLGCSFCFLLFSFWNW